MIVGGVRGRAPRVTLTVHGTGGRREAVEFIVDTGFTGDLTLPPSVLQEIAATVRGRGFMLLADGTERTCALCSVEVDEENGRKRVHQALALDGDPLLGMTFLRGRQLHVEGGEGGEVIIESL